MAIPIKKAAAIIKALGCFKIWPEISATQVDSACFTGDAGGDNTGSDRDQQGGDLGDQTVTDGQERIGLGRFGMRPCHSWYSR